MAATADAMKAATTSASIWAAEDFNIAVVYTASSSQMRGTASYQRSHMYIYTTMQAWTVYAMADQNTLGK